MDPTIWSAIGATATAVYTVAFAFSVPALARQLRAQSLSEAYDRLQTEDMRDARRIVYEIDDKGTPFAAWAADAACIAAAEKVCQRYDYFAKMVRHRLLPKSLVLKSWAWQVERLWKVVKPLVGRHRLRPGEGQLWADFQWLAHESSDWTSRHSSTGILSVD